MDDEVLHNGLSGIHIAADGLLSSIVDVASGRAVVTVGTSAGVPQLFRAIPSRQDIWDIDAHDLRNTTDGPPRTR